MPCQSEYMNPTPQERESKLVAELLVYAIPASKKAVEAVSFKQIVDISKNYYGKPERLDELTDFLCSLCKELREEEQNKIIYDGRNPMARKLADWWDRHQEFDKKRKAQEEAVREKEKLRQQALNKILPSLDSLTPEERKALFE